MVKETPQFEEDSMQTLLVFEPFGLMHF